MKTIIAYRYLFIILIISFLIRGIFLNAVPTATNNDQLHYLLDAKSMYATGENLAGNSSIYNILLFQYPPNETVQAELPYILSLLTVGPFAFSMLNASIASVFLGVGVVVLFYFIGKSFINKEFGVILSAIAAINPWLIVMSRSAYEMMAATFFYLLTFYIFQKATKKYLFLSIPVMLFAFYSYIGTKLIFLPFVFVCIAYSYFVINKKKYKKEYLIIASFAVLLVGLFIFQLSRQPELSRVSEIFLPWNSHVAKNVDYFRHVSLDSPLSSVVDNKYTVYVRTVIANIFNIFSPAYLFEHGDYFYGLERYGLFHIIDALFLLVGSLFFFTKYKTSALVVFVLGAVGILPQIFHDPEGTGNFSPHITLLIPFLVILVGYGVYFLTDLRVLKKHRRIVYVFLVILYLGSFLHFAQVYFYHYPLVGNILSFPNRAAASYIKRTIHHKKVVAHVSNPQLWVRDYFFYTNTMNNSNIQEIKQKLRNKDYSFNNLQFVQCTGIVDEKNAVVIYEASCTHKSQQTALEIAQLRDSASAFEIYNDYLCKPFGHKSFVSSVPLKNLHVETIEDKEFCETFVIQL